MSNRTRIACLLMVGMGLCAPVSAAALKVTMHKVSAEGVGDSIGTVEFRDSGERGLMIVPDLHGLTPGAHGFHVHENASCDPKSKDDSMVAGLAAGGHFDPGKTGKHEGPAGKGHLGDLPVLQVATNGSATMTVYAPHLHVSDLAGRSVMIHAGGDNYSDAPKPLGGGGARVACGVAADAAQ